MQGRRRKRLRRAGAAGALATAFAAGLLRPQDLLAAGWNRNAFGSKSPGDALKGLGAASLTESKDIVIDAPQIAENGAVVPIEVSGNLPNTNSIAVLVEKNPFPLAAQFDFHAGALPFVKINVKMGESSNVRVVAEAGGKFFTAVREVKVTLGAGRVKQAVAGELAPLDFIAQNVKTTDFEDPVFRPYALRTVNGVALGIIGQAFPYTPIANPRHHVPDWTFGIQEPRLQQLVDEVRARGARIVILLP